MSKPNGYSRMQIILHWAVFILILQQFIFNDAISDAYDKIEDGLSAEFNVLVLAHVAGGILVLLFAIWRLFLRKTHGVPEEVGEGLQAKIAMGAHHVLYLLMILLPLSGGVAWFGGIDAAAEIHELFKSVLLITVALHVIGALYHQFILRDGLMDRMRKSQK